VARGGPDAGPDPDAQHLSDDDYEAMLDAFEAELPAVEPLWLFGYGSLIWKPEIEHVEERVAVARAVAGDPLILLADEPTGNLDSKNGLGVMKLLSELHQGGSTLIMVTHDPAYARLATRTVSLFDGRIVDETGTTAA